MTQAAANSVSGARAAVILTVQQVLLVGLGLGVWHLSGRALPAFISITMGEIALGLLFAAILTGSVYGLQRLFPDASRKILLEQAKRYSFDYRSLSWPLIIAISIAAGIGEEALFRAGLQTIAGDYIGPVWGLLLANLAFALIHLSRMVVTAILFIIGLFLAAAYALSGSLLAVMIAHALYDVWALGNLRKVVIAHGDSE